MYLYYCLLQEDRYRAHIANSPTQYYQDSLIITDPYSHATDSPYTLLGNLGIPVIHPQLLATGNSSEVYRGSEMRVVSYSIMALKYICYE